MKRVALVGSSRITNGPRRAGSAWLTILAWAAFGIGSMIAQDLGGDLTLNRLLVDGEDWSLVAEGLGFADGPCTDAEGNFFFCDLRGPAVGIYRIGLDGQKTRISEEPVSGLKFGPDGRLYGCQGGKKRLIVLDSTTGKVEVLAENVQPNDLVVTSRGHVYFTETGQKQVTFVDAASRQLRVVDKGIGAPNGITLSPDQGTLAVSDFKGPNVWAFRIEADGSLSGKAPYMTMRLPIDPGGSFQFNHPPPLKKDAAGDGMTSDVAVRFYVATVLGVQIFDPTGRSCGVLSRPQIGQPLTSCAFSGPNRQYLYVTNGNRIFRRKVQAVGNVFFQAPKP